MQGKITFIINTRTKAGSMFSGVWASNVPCICLHALASMMARGRDMAGRNEHGVGRRKLTGMKECDCWGCQMSKYYFNSSSENLILMAPCYL